MMAEKNYLSDERFTPQEAVAETILLHNNLLGEAKEGV